MSQICTRAVVFVACFLLVDAGFAWIGRSRASLDAVSLSCSGAPQAICEETIVSEATGGFSGSRLACKSESSVLLASPGQKLFLGLGRPLSPLLEPGSGGSVRLASSAETDSSRGVTTYSLAYGPSWAYSGIWDKDEKAILLVDAPTKSIFHISILGKLVRQVITSSLGAESRFEPALLQVGPSGYVVEHGEGHLMWLDENYAVQDQLLLANMQDKDGYLAGGIWTWVDLGGEIIAFADKGKDPMDSKGWSAAVLRFKSRKATEFETVHDIALSSKTRVFSRLGFPVLASARGRAYILLVEGVPRIHEVGSGVRPLNAFPSGYDRFPDLGEVLDRDTAPVMYKQIERSQAVAGLYGWGDFLYVLTRRPNAVGDGTKWFVSKIDPSLDVVVSTVPLRTSSTNIILIPGKEHWIVVEKGRVETLGKQKIDSFQLVPAGFIESWNKDADALGTKSGSGSALSRTR